MMLKYFNMKEKEIHSSLREQCAEGVGQRKSAEYNFRIKKLSHVVFIIRQTPYSIVLRIMKIRVEAKAEEQGSTV